MGLPETKLKKAEKIGKKMRKLATSRKSKTHNRQRNTRPISVFDDVQDA